MSEPRYFYVTYTANDSIGQTVGAAVLRVVDKANNYLNWKETKAEILQNQSSIKGDIIITNIIEMNKSDYEEFTR